MAVFAGEIACVAAAYALSGMGEKAWRRFIPILGFLLLGSEIWKQWYLTERVYGYYWVWYFPFQLCSLPLYLCPVYSFVPEKGRHRISLFLMDFTLMGGVAAFMDTSGMHYPAPALTVHSYCWHFILIFLGSMVGFRLAGRRRWKARNNLPAGEERPPLLRMRDFLPTLPFWAAGVVIATVLNLCLWQYGEISMFYISPFEPSTQIVFRDIAGRYGIAAGNLAYLAAMVTAALLFHTVWVGVSHLFHRRGAYVSGEG